MFEELSTSDEDTLHTPHHKVTVLKGSPTSLRVIEEWLSTFHKLLEQRNEDALVRHLQALVPEYSPRRKSAAAEGDTPEKPMAIGA
jgi:FlaA1/EpsC-like NDP-sugar epimerase